MIRLQEILRDYLVNVYTQGKLASLSEAELRKCAFASHARAYDEGGLSLVVLLAPELIPVVATIPAREFNPGGENFGPTVKQLLHSLGLVAHRTSALTVAAAIPAHSRFFRRARQSDQRAFTQQIQLNRHLVNMRKLIASGRLNRVCWLQQITDRLDAIEFPDWQMAKAARKIVQLANGRKKEVAKRYRDQLREHPEFRPDYDRLDPGWSKW
jgi:hypothetical protein